LRPGPFSIRRGGAWTGWKTGKIPVGPAAKALFDWLKTHSRPLFKAFPRRCENAIEGLTAILQWPPALVVVALFVALTWYLQRRWKLPAASCWPGSCSS
jgi:ABC-type proline/glycine betaine transport system permease subunit